MASKMASSDFDEQFLTCPVCMLHFRDPKVLPGLHTFCKDCLQEWATKQQPLECPTCRVTVSLPEQGVDGLRSNFYVNNLLDFAAVKKGAEPGVPCQVCEGRVEGSKSWCADCATLMCESCTLLHRKFPFSKDHEVTTEATLKAEEGISQFQLKRHCPKHKNQELVFYCESCNTLICTACTVIDHRPGKDHNPVEIATVAQKKKERLQELLQQLDPRLKKVQDSVEEAERKISNLDPSEEEATKQAEEYFRQIIDVLQRRKDEVLSQISEQRRADGKALQTKKEAIEFELAGLTSAQTFCQQAVEHGSDVHILEVGDQVQTRLETLLTKQLDLESHWSEFQFIDDTTVGDFAEEAKNFGGLETNVDVSKCKVSVKPAVQGFPCVAELTIDNCKIAGPYVATNMKDPSGNCVKTQLQMKSGDVWEISYTPKVTGNHSLDVKVNSQVVMGSPYDVEVLGRDTPVLTIGRQGSGVGELNGPVGVAVNKDGNIAVVEKGNKRVQIFDSNDGHSLRSFPTEGEKPFGIDVDSNGRFVVTSFGENLGVRCYTKEGEPLNTFKPASLEKPLGVLALKGGRMVVVDPVQKSCLLLQPDGSLIRDIGKGRLQEPLFVAVDESRGVMFVSDQNTHKIVAFELDQTFMFDFGKQGDNEGELEKPHGVAVDQAGNIIVVDKGNRRVQVFGPNGTFIRTVTTVKGEDAAGIALTPDGYIAVSCFKGHCVEVYRYM